MVNKSVDNQGNEEQTPSKIFGIVAIIAGILVIISGYIVYSYFNQGLMDDGNKGKLFQVEVKDENSEGLIGEGAFTTRTNPIIEVNSFGITPTSSVKPNEPREPQIKQKAENFEKISAGSEVTTKENTPWTANNYRFGDIKSGDYTVISGDTLWEIADAVYGNGSDWQKIANANNVSYLANGNPLITPGQILVIPT